MDLNKKYCSSKFLCVCFKPLTSCVKLKSDEANLWFVMYKKIVFGTFFTIDINN